MPNVEVPLNSDPKASPLVAGDPPLCVDMDGTLIATDSLWEALLIVARKHPGAILRLPGWMAAGRAKFKEEIAEIAQG